MQATSFAQFTGLSAHGSVVRATAPSAGAAPVARVSLNIEAKQISRKTRNQQRHRRQRSRISGTPEQPRLAVYRSNEHIYAQVIDDVAQRTLATASTLSPSIKEGIASGSTSEAAGKVGEHIAELCLAKDINKVVFDRGGFLYHGRIQALAESAREKGLAF